MNRTVGIWVYVNKNGFIGTSIDEPIRDEKNGKWIVKNPFCNSQLYNMVVTTVEKTNRSWQTDPEYFEINLQ